MPIKTGHSGHLCKKAFPMKRVVVSGLGVVAPNGIGKTDFWNACVAGKSGVKGITCFDASKHPVRIAGQVPDFDFVKYLPQEHRKSAKIMGRAARFGVVASILAMNDSGLDCSKIDLERFGVVMGSGMVPVDLGEISSLLCEAFHNEDPNYTQNLGQHGPGKLAPLWILKYLPNMLAAHISLVHNAQGPNSTITTACAAGTQAVGEAFRLIARGDADLMIAGGADSRLDPLLMVAYSALGALSPATRSPEEVSRPFDGQRDGFVLGEGAGVLVLEELEHAKARGAEIYAEVLGMGTSFDAYSVTKPDPEAKGACRAINWALREAGTNASEIGYINAHGTSTRLNDLMETTAIKKVLGVGSAKVPLSSIKSMIGHLIGAAGAVEAVALAMTLKTGELPPTINQTQCDPGCDLDYVPNSAREIPVRKGLSTSFGFGGQNAALVMSSFAG